MNLQTLKETASAMVAPQQGILAMDESHPTCNKRFEKLGIDTTAENRRAYRTMLVTTPDLAKHISGAILFDETIRQQTLAEIAFPKYLSEVGIIPGIKVDAGAKELAGQPGEKITEGLDGLRERLSEYAKLGARFAKWRAVITIDSDIPSEACISANAHALARYATLCQEQDMVPIVEPEVLMDGGHTIERCYEVTEYAQHLVFAELEKQGVELEGIVLKPNMIVSGSECATQANAQQIAEMTLQCLLNTVPASVPGIAFLSGGQSDAQASENLNAINMLAQAQQAPWQLTFSYGRALQQDAMKVWGGSQDNVAAAQAAAHKRAHLNACASSASYTPDME